jgi:hypothetical protein
VDAVILDCKVIQVYFLFGVALRFWLIVKVNLDLYNWGISIEAKANIYKLLEWACKVLWLINGEA